MSGETRAELMAMMRVDHPEIATIDVDNLIYGIRHTLWLRNEYGPTNPDFSQEYLEVRGVSLLALLDRLDAVERERAELREVLGATTDYLVRRYTGRWDLKGDDDLVSDLINNAQVALDTALAPTEADHA